MSTEQNVIYVERDKEPKLVTPIFSHPKTPQEAAEGHDTVTMFFPEKVMFTVEHGYRVLYPAKSVCEVPREWSNHWFLINNGARIYNRPVSVMELPQPEIESPRSITKAKKK
jgi:hypothetical protein